MISTTITPKTEQKVKEIADYLFRNNYPHTGVLDVFEKFGNDEDTIRALAVLESGNLIRIDKHLGDHVSLWSFVIRDKDGKDIQHEMIMDDYNSDVFGNWFYDTGRTYCYEHLGDDLPDPNCMKCVLEDSSRRCVAHNQSMTFCKKCRDITKKYKELTPKEKSEEFINLCCKMHNEQLILRKGLELETPKYETMIKEKSK